MVQPLHDTSDPRNATILINVNGAMTPRAEAMVSVFDSGFMLGDGIWEGMRVVGGRIAFLDRHLDRLFEGIRAIALDIGLDRTALTQRLYETIDANQMTDGAHIRLMVTRGIRSTPYQDPARRRRRRDHRDHRRVQATAARTCGERTQPVHRPCPPRRSGGAGSQAQFAQQIELHHRLHPGGGGGSGRGVDARSRTASSRPAIRPISSSSAAARCGPRAATIASAGSPARTSS